MRWHPFAERFPLLEGEEWESFKASVEESRGNHDPITFRLVGGEKEYLDGRNRAKACEELGLTCREECRLVADRDVKAFILRRNLHRRHLPLEVRRAFAAELRADGQSTRRIAAALGVSAMTVHRDLNRPGVTPVTPETPDGVVTGKDGKPYPASRPASTIADRLVERLERFADDLERGQKTPEREPGDDTDAIEEERRLEKSLPKPGSILFDWKAFEDLYGRLVREVDKLGRAYRAKEGPCARGLREQLQRFYDAFKAWHKVLTGAAR